jgi:hypothetical protein
MGMTTQEPTLDGYTKRHQRRSLDRILADIEALLPEVRPGEPLGDLDRERERLDWEENQQRDGVLK